MLAHVAGGVISIQFWFTKISLKLLLCLNMIHSAPLATWNATGHIPFWLLILNCLMVHFGRMKEICIRY